MSITRHGLLAIALVLAGCTGLGPQPSRDPPTEGVAAPEWTSGMRWTYRLIHDNGTTHQEATVEMRVLDVRRVADVEVYAVEETRADASGTAVNVTRYFSTQTLSEVYDRCPATTQAASCRWTDTELLFPLWDGKTWAARKGRMPIEYDATATDLGEGRWRVILRFGPSTNVTLVYDEKVRNIESRVEHNTNPLGSFNATLELTSCALPHAPADGMQCPVPPPTTRPQLH